MMARGIPHTSTTPFARSSRHKPRRWPLAFRFVKGAVHRAIIVPVLVHATFAALVVYLDLYVDAKLGLPDSIIPSFSIVVGLMLVFRNETSYNRFWDGRNYLSVVITSIRNLTRAFLACTANRPANDDVVIKQKVASISSLVQTERSVRILLAILYAVKGHLRAEWGADVIPGKTGDPYMQNARSTTEFDDLLPMGLKNLSEQGVSIPYQLSYFVEQYIKEMTDNDIFHSSQASQLQLQLNNLTDAFGRMETIRLTPIPVALLIHQKQVLGLFGAVLPFGLAEGMRWWSVLIVALVMFSLYGIDGIGTQLEDPFGFDRNDIKMDAIIDDIREEIMAMVEEWRSSNQDGRIMFFRRSSDA